MAAWHGLDGCAIQQENPDAPPLRSCRSRCRALSGTLSFSQRLLRQGKIHIDGEIAADGVV